jgi:L-serine dehydratase
MESIRSLYRIGHGPSSSHTMGPRNAALKFLKEFGSSLKYEAQLFGSLAATGKGHLTDKALNSVFVERGKSLVIHWYPDEFKEFHPNALTLKAFDKNETLVGEKTYYSVGGGKIVEQSEINKAEKSPYPVKFASLNSILKYCERKNLELWEFVVKYEGSAIFEFVEEIWSVMEEAVERGLKGEGLLPGALKLERKAAQFYKQAKELKSVKSPHSFVISYALAVSEENGDGNKIVTAPTCGSCGVLPGTLYYMKKDQKREKQEILKALLVAALIGNLVKKNGSISGAEVGCQGEVGVACAMASAAIAFLMGANNYQIEYAAEMGIEHHLGLTCDPIMGLVQIPCIERNALGAMRSFDHALYALLSDGKHKVSFDEVVEVMMETGQALPSLYRETSLGGLATLVTP